MKNQNRKLYLSKNSGGDLQSKLSSTFVASFDEKTNRYQYYHLGDSIGNGWFFHQKMPQM